MTPWYIFINEEKIGSYDETVTLAHKLGHAVGLNDLYESYNSGVLMYGYTGGTATYPTLADKTGAQEGIK